MIEVDYGETVRETIIARVIKLDGSVRVNACICERLELGYAARVGTAFVAANVELDGSTYIQTLSLQQGAKVERGYAAKAPYNPVLPKEEWEAAARQFMKDQGY